MRETSKVRIAAGWHRPVSSTEERRRRMLDFLARIRGLHALLDDWAPFPKRGGDRQALQQPSIFGLDQTQWEKIFAPGPSDVRFLHNHFLWNRVLDRKLRTESMTVFNDGSYPMGVIRGRSVDDSGWHMSNLPACLVNEVILLSVAEAAITAYDADSLELGEQNHLVSRPPPSTGMYDPRMQEYFMTMRELAEKYGGQRYSVIYDNFDTPLWKLWLKDGEPWPDPGIRGDTHLQLWQCDEPYECEDWLGGKLYTWPQFKPFDDRLSLV